MKTATINLYEFNELNEKAKVKAINEHREFMLSIMQHSDFISGDDKYDTEDELEAFNQECDFIANEDAPIVENIEANEYLFFASGELANCVTYCGSHPKAGIIEFKIGEDVYII